MRKISGFLKPQGVEAETGISMPILDLYA